MYVYRYFDCQQGALGEIKIFDGFGTVQKIKV